MNDGYRSPLQKIEDLYKTAVSMADGLRNAKVESTQVLDRPPSSGGYTIIGVTKLKEILDGMGDDEIISSGSYSVLVRTKKFLNPDSLPTWRKASSLAESLNLKFSKIDDELHMWLGDKKGIILSNGFAATSPSLMYEIGSRLYNLDA